MVYNKAKEEQKWRRNKDAEEELMRSLGVDEDTIKKLRNYDWEMFNSDRRYYQHLQDADSCLETLADKTEHSDFRTVEDFLDHIDDPQLYQILANENRLTVQIALWKSEGYTGKDISLKCGLSVGAINFRMWKLRKKLNNFSNR